MRRVRLQGGNGVSPYSAKQRGGSVHKALFETDPTALCGGGVSSGFAKRCKIIAKPPALLPPSLEELIKTPPLRQGKRGESPFPLFILFPLRLCHWRDLLIL